jgi:hypothetical protein
MSKQTDFRPIYVDPRTVDQKPVQRPDLDDLQTNAGKQLQPRCWRCFAPVAQCKCGGM